MVVFRSDARSVRIVSCAGNKGLEEGRTTLELRRLLRHLRGIFEPCRLHGL